MYIKSKTIQKHSHVLTEVFKQDSCESHRSKWGGMELGKVYSLSCMRWLEHLRKCNTFTNLILHQWLCTVMFKTWSTLVKILLFCVHTWVSICVLMNDCFIIMAPFKGWRMMVIIRVLCLFHPVFLCFSLSLHKAITNFYSRIPCKAPVPARSQVLVGVWCTMNMALQGIWTR